ncbi:MAG: ChaN family lipoprotein [Deltaproteobacteria bacterium]|nr:ChaN family lipoprotein [Deltaproteobacteria bacterium]
MARDHPLAGRIWDAPRGRWIDETTLVAGLTGARFVLLGEKHDNRDHHVLEARVVSRLARAVLPRRPAVAFEMLEVDSQAAVDAAVAASPTDPDAIARAVEWHHGGWPEFATYRPVFQAALDLRLRVVAANLPAPKARALVREGLGSLPEGEAARLGLDRPLPDAVRAAMARELNDAHCGMLPEHMLDGMVLAQRARDATMADMLASQTGGAILVAGAGHVRKDRGIPSLLDGGAAALAFEEVAPDRTDPRDYAARWDSALPFDYVWFTPVATSDDPCAGMEAAANEGGFTPP